MEIIYRVDFCFMQKTLPQSLSKVYVYIISWCQKVKYNERYVWD